MQPDLFTALPFVRHSATSYQAAERMSKRQVSRDREAIWQHLQYCGSATDAELCSALGKDGSTIRPRRVELVRAGLAKDSGLTRKTASGRNATVWVPA